MGNTIKRQVGPGRLYEIDLFRFLAAMGVVFYHYGFRGYVTGKIPDIHFPMLSSLARYGFLGVNLFFIISGFVILMTAERGSKYRFVVSRISRLYPAFWAGVLLTSIFIMVAGDGLYHITLPQVICNLSMISGFWGIEHIDAVYWSLLVEIKFYGIIFILLAFRMISKIQFVLGAWLCVSLCAVSGAFPGFVGMVFFPQWSSYFIAGSICYLIRKNGMSLARAAILSGAYCLSMYHGMMKTAGFANRYNTELSFGIIGILITLFYALFIMVAFDKTGFLRNKRLVVLGSLTYPLYLIHQNIGFILLHRFGNPANRYLALSGVILSVIGISYLINRYVERTLARVLKKGLFALRDTAKVGAHRTENG